MYETLHCHFFHVCTVMFIKKYINMLLNVKRVATDMQYHMFSLYTIKCTVSICENLKKCYTIGLLFIFTEAQMSLLLETSDSPFPLPTNQHNLHSVVCRIC